MDEIRKKRKENENEKQKNHEEDSMWERESKKGFFFFFFVGGHKAMCFGSCWQHGDNNSENFRGGEKKKNVGFLGKFGFQSIY